MSVLIAQSLRVLSDLHDLQLYDREFQAEGELKAFNVRTNDICGTVGNSFSVNCVRVLDSMVLSVL